jgi:hypothetical protein
VLLLKVSGSAELCVEMVIKRKKRENARGRLENTHFQVQLPSNVICAGVY